MGVIRFTLDPVPTTRRQCTARGIIRSIEIMRVRQCGIEKLWFSIVLRVNQFGARAYGVCYDEIACGTWIISYAHPYIHPCTQASLSQHRNMRGIYATMYFTSRFPSVPSFALFFLCLSLSLALLGSLSINFLSLCGRAVWKASLPISAKFPTESSVTFQLARNTDDDGACTRPGTHERIHTQPHTRTHRHSESAACRVFLSNRAIAQLKSAWVCVCEGTHLHSIID